MSQPMAGHHAVIFGQPWTGRGLTPTWRPRDSLFLQDQWEIPGPLASPQQPALQREADKIKRMGFAQLDKDFDGS